MTAIGLQWTQAADTYARLEASAGMTVAQTTALCNTVAPWAYMRRVNLLDNGVVSACYGDRCYTNTDVATMGQCMVYVPKFWYYTKHTTSPTVYRWYISDTGTDTIGGSSVTWKVHPAFIRNGVTKSQVYVGAYEGYVHDMSGTLKLESRAGVKPSGQLEVHALTGTPNGTISSYRTWAHNRVGTTNKWELLDFNTLSMIQLQYLLEYGTFNSGNFFTGVTSITDDSSTNMAVNTGYTSALGNTSGQVPVTHYQTLQTTYPMSHRGTENIFGNMFEYIDGINITNRVAWIADHDFASDTFTAPYVSTGLTLVGSNTFCNDLSTSATYDYYFQGATAGGGLTTYLCQFTYQDTGNRTLLHGGDWFSPTHGNMWYSHELGSTLYTGRDYGARLMYIG